MAVRFLHSTLRSIQTIGNRNGITDDYLYDLAGHMITQVSGTGWWIRGEIYAAGQHIATYENDLPTATTFFTHTDHLGTERVETSVNGTSCETITNTAFGDGLNTSGSCDPSELRYTGKQRDWESNLDDFGARFYSSQLGRFMSADWSAVPAPVPYANLSNPQTLFRSPPLSCCWGLQLQRDATSPPGQPRVQIPSMCSGKADFLLATGR